MAWLGGVGEADDEMWRLARKVARRVYAVVASRRKGIAPYFQPAQRRGRFHCDSTPATSNRRLVDLLCHRRIQGHRHYIICGTTLCRPLIQSVAPQSKPRLSPQLPHRAQLRNPAPQITAWASPSTNKAFPNATGQDHSYIRSTSHRSSPSPLPSLAMTTRVASHAGSWYADSKSKLSGQLDDWLDAVPPQTIPIGTASARQGPVSIPAQGARAIIAPHAGYAYSGPAAAWAYKSMDWSNAKRIFLLGPSHHYYLTGAATTSHGYYATPLGALKIDTQLTNEIAKEWGLERMNQDVDEAEHSLEMHLPYIYKMLSLNFKPDQPWPLLVPIMVGNTSPSTEQKLGSLLSPHLPDPSNLFIISSDFCHWGSRFRYTYYQAPNHSPQILRSSSSVPKSYPIHESIAAVDKQSMDAVESGSHNEFLKQVEETGNTVCGRHPIGVLMAAVEACEGLEGGAGMFRFVRYERSSLVESLRDSSVSYCSAFAVF
ncbi:UPF0103-domain-containing protein [Lojkania enalia]|uniref:UPF0103-domain-containing protein n=1 Tax=Lojkania enalia TaxID=147567 RepID=A0A9P4K2W2_9PLEO|nr:UPF0103-domain-containing protein [Didymosphaeria enalia]